MSGRGVRGAWALALALAFVASSHPLARPAASGPPVVRPSIVLIMTDDQRWDTMWAMPTVQSRLIARGVTFRNGFVVNSLCCPSRTSILTGQYSHSTGIWTNGPPHGGFAKFDDSSTVATWLQGAGYDTAFVGKYLNGYDGVTIPPGWDRWVAFDQPAYFDYDLNVDGTIIPYGSGEADYSTDVLADEAVAFIGGVDPATPLFLMFTPWAPHGPVTPAPRHEGTFSNLPPFRPPSYNEKDVSDKPRWVRRLPRLGPEARRKLDRFRRKQYRSLLSVDEAIGDILGALESAGRLQNTMVVFISDNGYLWGEHRKRQKKAAYNESIRIPFVVRFDPFTGRRVDRRLVLNIDLAPTFAELAGVGAPGADGRSLVPLLAQQDIGWRRAFLVEHVQKKVSGIPTYCAVRKAKRLYVRYRTGEEEYYKLGKDRFELENRAERPAAKKAVRNLRRKAKRLCQPPPPGFSF